MRRHLKELIGSESLPILRINENLSISNTYSYMFSILSEILIMSLDEELPICINLMGGSRMRRSSPDPVARRITPRLPPNPVGRFSYA